MKTSGKTIKTTGRGKQVAKKTRAADASVSAEAGADTPRRCVIPLNRLVPDPRNVRRFASEAGIEELCAMIATNGLLQNLDVRPAPKGKFYVTAGARRLRALKELAKRGVVIETEGVKVTGAYPVAVMVLSEKHIPTEVSLVENIGRTSMNVADEVEAFRTLVEEDGFSSEQIGDRFGISHATVRRRVKLARVSPRLMGEFREGKATLDQLEALAVADDHAEQETAFYGLPEWNRDARQIRARLTSEKIRADNRLVHFIGVEAYTEAGGTITRDLFSEDADVYLDSKALVMKLVSERLAATARDIEAEGWKWTEYFASERECGPVLPVIPSFKREHTEAENAEVAEIMAFVEANEPAYEAGDMTEDEIAGYEARLARMDEIDAACIGYDPELVAFAGARVFLDHEGEIVVRRSLLKIDDQRELAARERAKRDADRAAEAEARGEAFEPEGVETGGEASPAGEPGAGQDGAGLSAAVIEDLTKARTAALAVELAKRPDVALAALVHALALPLLYAGGSGFGQTPAVSIRATPAPLHVATPDEDNGAAFAAFDALMEDWRARLPANPADLWTWCLEAEAEQLNGLMACLVAATVNAVAFRHEEGGYAANRLAHADALAQAVGLDMRAYWTPGREFFRRVPKSIAARAVTEAGCDPKIAAAILKGSKAEAIEIAEAALAGRGWLPEALRMAGEVGVMRDIAEDTGEACPVDEHGEGIAEAAE